MTTFYRAQPAVAPSPAQLLLRKPKRLTATLSWQVHQRLEQRALNEGRSLSNLVAHLLEVATG
jgi:hypothetical protein